MSDAYGGGAMAADSQNRRVRCRYLERYNDQCTAETVDPDGEILLCTKHLAQAIQLVQIHMASARLMDA